MKFESSGSYGIGTLHDGHFIFTGINHLNTKVNESVYIVSSEQWHAASCNNFLLQVPNDTLRDNQIKRKLLVN